VERGVLGGDPGGEDVVGVVREVVADQSIEQICVVVEVSGGDRDELAVPGGGGVLGSPGKKPGGFVGHQSRGHEQAGRVVRAGSFEDLGRGCLVATDQPAKQNLGVCGHGLTVFAGADDALTMT
jgi:hypothetical protein